MEYLISEEELLRFAGRTWQMDTTFKEDVKTLIKDKQPVEEIGIISKSDCVSRRLIATEFNDIGQNRQREVSLIPNMECKIYMMAVSK